MNVAIVYHDSSVNPMILSMLQSIIKMLESKSRNYTLITNYNDIDPTVIKYNVIIIVLQKESDKGLIDKIKVLKEHKTIIVSIATATLENNLNKDIFIDISPNFITYLKNGTLIYTINKVLCDIDAGKTKSKYKPLLRKNIILQTLASIKAKSYLEIGVSNGENYLDISAPFIMGVDPIEPNQKIKNSLNDNRLYFQQTSDDFYENNKNLLNQKRVDLTFIDGAHNYHQALRDFKNSVEYLNQGGFIIMHDCNPISSIVETPANYYEDACEIVKTKGINPYGYVWTGDVWKTLINIRSFYNNLEVITLDCDFGLGIIKKGTPQSMLNFSSEEIENLNYSNLENNRADLLNLTEPEDFINKL